MTTRKKYLIPDDHLPEDTICIPVHVPNDPLYLYAFMGSLAHFGKWVAWDDEGDGRAKDVAQLWKDAEEITRAAWAAGECGLMIRQNPDSPCELQQSMDGETWETWAVISDCTSGPDEGVPFPSGTAPDAGYDAAANAADWLDTILCMIVGLIDGGASDGEIISQVGAYIAAYAPGAITAEGIKIWIDGLRALSMAQRAAYCGGDVPGDLWNGIICAGAVGLDDGHWLDKWADGISDWLSGSAQWLIDGFEAVARTFGINDQNTISRTGGGGGGAGFGDPDCGWCAWMQHSTGLQYGFAINTGLAPIPEFQIGTRGHWYSAAEKYWLGDRIEDVGDTPGFQMICDVVQVWTEPVDLTHATLYLYYSASAASPINKIYLDYRDEDGVWHQAANWTPVTGEQGKTFDGYLPAATGIRALLSAIDGYNIRLRGWRVRGIGEDPFGYGGCSF